ncbi:MAG: hypothetical protein Q8Q13_02590 [bacterium]|nr:hypothetical protein [bacterium]
MGKDDVKKDTSAPQDDLQQIRKELKAEAEKLKALEIRVGAIEQNLLGN